MPTTTTPEGYRYTDTQWLPLPPEQLWPFFSDAYNLEQITPDTVRFRVVTPKPIDMRQGAIIDYKLRVHGLPIRWRTRIELWEPPHRFIDNQIKGPYKKWRHEHRFEPVAGGTLCTDRVDYLVPGGPLAGMIHALSVGPDVRKIFAYRKKVLADMYADGRVIETPPVTAASGEGIESDDRAKAAVA